MKISHVSLRFEEKSHKNERDPAEKFPRCLFQNCILSNLEVRELIDAAKVSKKWKKMVWEFLNTKIDKSVLGPHLWKKYLGKVDVMPEIPEEMKTYMKSGCPYNPGKMILETHAALYIPPSINEKPLTINNIEKFVTYREFCQFINKNDVCNAALESGWILITNTVIPESLDKSIEEQQNLIKKAKKYELPSTLEIILYIFMNSVCAKNVKSAGYSNLYTRCKEKIGQYHLLVRGSIDSKIELIDDYLRNTPLVGVGAVLRF